MPDLPHNRVAAVSSNIVEQSLRAFHFADKSRARTLFENVPGEDDHQLIAPDNSPLLVDNANPIGIAIERNSQVGVVLSNRVDRELQVLGNGWVRMVIWKTAIGFAEQLYDLAPKLSI